MAKYLRKVIRIRAEDSPNVKLALAQQAKGIKPTGEQVLPGVIDWDTYQFRRKTWDAVKQSIGLDGLFYEGAELRMYPPAWIAIANRVADSLPENRTPTAMGVDPAEGGDSSCWSLVDSQGLIRLIRWKTPDTTVIPNKTISLINEYNMDPSMVMFDQGGGGGVHVDTLRSRGYNVSEVSFGESTAADPVRYAKLFEIKLDERRERFNYKNRRAQMYHMLRQKIDPSDEEVQPFGIPSEQTELIRQMTPIPLSYDEEGRIYVIPKRKKQGLTSNTPCLTDLIGCSPDELDSLVLAIYALRPDKVKVSVGSLC